MIIIACEPVENLVGKKDKMLVTFYLFPHKIFNGGFLRVVKIWYCVVTYKEHNWIVL